MVHAESTGTDEAERSPKQFEFGTWYPIETAPKDGSWILLSAPGYRVVFLSWRMDAWRFAFSQRKLSTFQPTHWMPMPPPPCSDDLSNDSESDAGSLNQITSSESNSDA